MNGKAARSKKNWSLLSLALAGLGVALLTGGAGLFFSQAQSREAARVAALPIVRPTELETLADGVEVLLPGRLVPREAVNPQGFVVYSEQYFLRRHTEGASRGRDQWGERAVPRPLIAVEDAEERALVCNHDYQLVRPPHTWQSDVALRSGDLGREATRRQEGFKPGDEVTVDGRVSRASATACLRAKALFGGAPDGYREEQRSGVVALRVVGGVFSGLGALVLVIVGLVRRKR